MYPNIQGHLSLLAMVQIGVLGKSNSRRRDSQIASWMQSENVRHDVGIIYCEISMG